MQPVISPEAGHRRRPLEPHEERLVRGTLVRNGVPAADLDDAVQDVQLRLLVHADEERAVPAWLATVARNVAMDHHRAVRRREDLRRRLAAARPLTPHLPDPDARMVLADALCRLTPEQRRVLGLRFVTGLSVGETAGVLGVAEGTVKSRLHRAARHLRRRPLGGR